MVLPLSQRRTRRARERVASVLSGGEPGERTQGFDECGFERLRRRAPVQTAPGKIMRERDDASVKSSTQSTRTPLTPALSQQGEVVRRHCIGPLDIRQTNINILIVQSP